MTFSISRRTLVAALVGSVATVAAGVAYAAIPGSDGVIHGCYSANGAGGTNGTQLNIIDSDKASCSKGQQQITWSQTGPAGKDGEDGDKGDKGDKGDTGEKGDPGSSTAYTNYGGPLQAVSAGLTRTVASLTLPPGKYTLSATVVVARVDGTAHVQCAFVSTGTVNAHVALASVGSGDSVAIPGTRVPLIGDLTTAFESTVVFLRCTGLSGTADAAGNIIATQVGAIEPSE